MIKNVVSMLVLILIVGCGQQMNPEALEATAEKPARDAYATQQAEDFAIEATLWAIETRDAMGDEALDSYYATMNAQLEEITYYVSVPVANVRTCPDLSCPIALKLTMNTPLFDPFPAESAPGWFEVEIDGKWYYIHQSVISFDTGEKIYHLPDDEFYNQTEINTDYGERWFCTSEEAKANGWRRAYQ